MIREDENTTTFIIRNYIKKLSKHKNNPKYAEALKGIAYVSEHGLSVQAANAILRKYNIFLLIYNEYNWVIE